MQPVFEPRTGPCTQTDKMRVGERAAAQQLMSMTNDVVSRLRAEGYCRRVLDDPSPLSDQFRTCIMHSLRAKRMFPLMELMAERIISETGETPELCRLYAQSLIENGKLSVAQLVLKRGMAMEDCPPGEYADMWGLMGRAQKQ